MYKSDLPLNCPPKNAQEQSINLYRLLVENDIIESFKNYIDLFPENEAYKKQCRAFGLSLFDNVDKAKELKTKGNNTHKVIAKVELNQNTASFLTIT